MSVQVAKYPKNANQFSQINEAIKQNSLKQFKSSIKKCDFSNLEDFHKSVFENLLQMNSKNCNICQNDVCKVGKMEKLPSTQTMFAYVFACSKFIRNNKISLANMTNKNKVSEMIPS